MEKKYKDFVLDYITPEYKEFFNNLRDGKDTWYKQYVSDEGRIRIRMAVKNEGTCFDKPIVDYTKVKVNDRLWAEDTGGSLLQKGEWFPIVITKKYGGVIFYRWLEGPHKGKLCHFELDSVFSDKMVYPYIIRLPKDIEITDCYNPKQIFEIV